MQTDYTNSKRYNNTSLAYSTHALPLPYPGEDRNLINRRLREQQKRRQVAYMRQIATLATVMVFLFAGCIALVFSYAMVSQKQTELNRTRAEIATLENENNMLRSSISAVVDLNEVREIAESRLGMISPESHQIVTINVPRQSYTIHAQ